MSARTRSARDHALHRVRRPRPPGCAPASRRGRRRRPQPSRPTPPCTCWCSRQPCCSACGGDLRQLGADLHAVDRPRRPSREGERPPVERRIRGQHLCRATAGGAPDRRGVLAALLRRRRDVRGLGPADLADSTPGTLRRRVAAERQPWKSELADGVPLAVAARPAALARDRARACSTCSPRCRFATFVLFGQEVLGTSPTEFALLGTGGAIGGIIGGWTASSITKRIGEGARSRSPCSAAAPLHRHRAHDSWPLVWLMFSLSMVVVIFGT